MNGFSPPNISTFGAEIDQLYTVILILTSIAFFLTEGVLLYALIRFRAREGGRSTYVHSNQKLELGWSIIPGLILFGLAVYQYGAWNTIKRDFPLPEESVQVELSPRQFLWAARYPGADNQLGTDDDIEAPNNVIHVPVDEPVLVYLRSQDVIHSFFVPALRLKQDALPGKVIRAWFEATQVGEYDVACAELCGPQHYTMNATLTVESRADFEEWLAKRQAAQAEGEHQVADADQPRGGR